MTKTGFEDMADDLPFTPGAAPAKAVVTEQSVGRQLERAINTSPIFTEPCPKCRGTGTWMSFSGRTAGTCFHCKGKGTKSFSTSPEQRRKAAAARAQRKVREEEKHNAKIAAWREQNPVASAWMIKQSPRFDFARSMLDALLKYGSLTERQLAAVQSCIEKDAVRQAARAADQAAAPHLDALHAVMQKHASFYAGDLTLTRRNADQLVWIKHADAEKVIGKIDGGVLSLWNRPGVDMDSVRSMLAEFNAAPLETAMKYGKLSGRCCSCGRELTNDGSIDAGIGPICAAKFGG